MNKLILTLFIGSITLFSCKREKLEVVGPQAPELITASSNFQLAKDSFQFQLVSSNFNNISAINWLNASFNERVSWEIKITGTQTKAYKIFRGVSSVIDKSNSTWTGTHSGINFFKKGEKAIAQLTVLGSKKIWYDTTTIVSVKDYGAGSNVVILSDVDNDGSGWGYWDYASPPNTFIMLNTYQVRMQYKNPDTIGGVQGLYRSIQATNNGQSNYWVGGFGTYGNVMSSPSTKFSGVSLNDVFLNFYVRRRTHQTETMTIRLGCLKSVSHNGRNVLLNSSLGTYTVDIPSGTDSGSDLVPNGFVAGPRGDGWHLVSIRLSSMPPPQTGQPAFNPNYITSIGGDLGVYPETGFDIDFITITKGPFDPDAE